jgi:pullulanase/glycogen debranching enzyme
LRKNQLACLLLAQGLPLILAGDEVGNTQNGNNNAYCQDNERCAWDEHRRRSPHYPWRCADWRGRPWHEAVIYELHPGADGRFRRRAR